MINYTLKFLKDFYNKNLFERIIIYIFLSALIVKIVFELGLGQWSFIQSQNKQWIFYGLLAVDYIISYRKILNLRVTVNPMSVFALVFFIMCAHGLFVGIILHNQPFVIFNDLVPLLMIGLNILRMQSSYEYKEPDFRFLLTTCTVLALSTCFFGFIAQTIGRPSGPSMGAGSIYLPLLFAAIFMLRPFPKWVAVAAFIMIAMTFTGMNRTTMAFMAVAVSGYIFIKMLKNPVIGIMAITIVTISLSLAWTFLPEDSPTYQRIIGLSHVDLSERTGSIGERQAEWDAINTKLDSRGTTVKWLGLGFGGVYEMQSTHQYITNYGHAHYSWSWFNLRFGRSGYLYLVLLIAALTYNSIHHIQRKNENGVFVSLLCMLGLAYCMTYVNSILLLVGANFFTEPQPYLSYNAKGPRTQS